MELWNYETSALSLKHTYFVKPLALVWYMHFIFFKLKTFKNQKYAVPALNLNLSYVYTRIQTCVGISRASGG